MRRLPHCVQSGPLLARESAACTVDKSLSSSEKRLKQPVSTVLSCSREMASHIAILSDSRKPLRRRREASVVETFCSTLCASLSACVLLGIKSLVLRRTLSADLSRLTMVLGTEARSIRTGNDQSGVSVQCTSVQGGGGGDTIGQTHILGPDLVVLAAHHKLPPSESAGARGDRCASIAVVPVGTR